MQFILLKYFLQVNYCYYQGITIFLMGLLTFVKNGDSDISVNVFFVYYSPGYNEIYE